MNSPAPPPRNWWQRNWKWCLPLLVLMLVALVCSFIAAILFTVRGAMMGTDVYTDALSRARSHPAVSASLGEPVTPGFMPTGSINTSSSEGGSGTADLTINLEGPRGKGRVIIAAERRRGSWEYQRLLFLPDGAIASEAVQLAPAGTAIRPPQPQGQ